MNSSKTSSLKTISSVFILICLILVAIYSIALHEVEVAKVTVEITGSEPFTASSFNDSGKDGLIGEISLHKINMVKLSAPGGNEMQMPGISVALYDNKGLMLSDWVSVRIKDKGFYELELGLNRNVIRGEPVSVAVYVNDEKGNVVVGKKEVVVWE